MKKIFVAYADEHLAYSLRRIGRQARRLNVFDEVFLYTPADLPCYILQSPLMQHERGGGYWAWKPAIIYETLKAHDEDDIVVYADAGCTLNTSSEWELMFKLMREYDFICFHYDAEMPIWEKFGNTSTKIKFWTKQSAITFLDYYCHNDSWHDALKIWGGLLFVKGKDNSLLKQWLDITLHHPEVIMDSSDEDMLAEPAGFAFHKHDQSVLTALAYCTPGTLVLPEVSETAGTDAFVWASRIRAASLSAFIAWKLKYYGRELLGDTLFDRCKALLHV